MSLKKKKKENFVLNNPLTKLRIENNLGCLSSTLLELHITLISKFKGRIRIFNFNDNGRRTSEDRKVAIHMADVDNTITSPHRHSSIHHRFSSYQNRTSSLQPLLRLISLSMLSFFSFSQ